jgi:hypothetical protein
MTAMDDGLAKGTLVKVAESVRSASKTAFPTLTVGSLQWQAICEWCLAHPAARRTPDERKLLRELMSDLQTSVSTWRAEMYKAKADAYLANGRTPMHFAFEMSKALPSPLERLSGNLMRDVAVERWGAPLRAGGVPDVRRVPPAEPDAAAKADQWLKEHRLAEGMDLDVVTDRAAKLSVINASGTAALKMNDRLGVFDIVMVDAGAPAQSIGLTASDASAAAKDRIGVKVEAGSELTYFDVLQLAYEQNEKVLEERAAKPAAVPNGNAIEVGPMRLGPVDPLLLGPKLKQGDGIWLLDFWLF